MNRDWSKMLRLAGSPTNAWFVLMLKELMPDYGDEDGWVHIKRETLAEHSGMTVRQVRGAMDNMEAAGRLKRNRNNLCLSLQLSADLQHA